MNDTTRPDGGGRKGLARVKWFSFIFAGALVFLGVKILLYAKGVTAEGDGALADPAKLAEQAEALGKIRMLSYLSLGLGGLALLVGAVGSAVRAPWVKLLELLEAAAFVGAGGFILATRGDLFGPALPSVLIVIGAIQGIAAIRGYRQLAAARPGGK